MTYSTSNPPALVTQGGIDGSLPQTWVYKSSDLGSAVDASGYISNGGNLGMKVGDVLVAYDASGGLITTHKVIAVSSTAPGAVDLGDGTTIGGTTNSD